MKIYGVIYLPSRECIEDYASKEAAKKAIKSGEIDKIMGKPIPKEKLSIQRWDDDWGWIA